MSVQASFSDFLFAEEDNVPDTHAEEKETLNLDDPLRVFETVAYVVDPLPKYEGDLAEERLERPPEYHDEFSLHEYRMSLRQYSSPPSDCWMDEYDGDVTLWSDCEETTLAEEDAERHITALNQMLGVPCMRKQLVPDKYRPVMCWAVDLSMYRDTLVDGEAEWLDVDGRLFLRVLDVPQLIAEMEGR